jgi:hypothetical protein
MKTLIQIIILLGATACSRAQTPTVPPSGDLCITLVSVDYVRVSEAFGSVLGLKDQNGQPRGATVPEIEQAILDYTEGTTHDYEKRKDMAAFSPPPIGGATKDKAASIPTPKPKK